MNTDKSAYRACLKESAPVPLFFQDWYLDAVAEDGEWQVAFVAPQQKLVAAFPYFKKKKGPFQYITMPHLCRYMGPYIDPAYRHPGKAHRLLRSLIEQLPEVHAFHQHFHPSLQDWLPFYWQGFRQQTRYTYQMKNLGTTEEAFQRLHRDYRNNKIPKAEKIVHLREDLSPEKFYQIASLSFNRQGLQQPFTKSFFLRLESEVSKHQSGKLFFATDQEGNIHSVAWLLWDNQSSYYLIAGDDPQLRSSGAGVWLAWQMIRYTIDVLKLPTFDFLGSMIEPIARVRRQFGAEATPYFEISKYPSLTFWLVEQLLARIRR